MRPLCEINQAAIKHIEAGTTDLGDTETSNPVSSYLDLSLFDQEMANTFRNRPVPVVASSKLPNAGDYFAAEVAGIPLVVLRTEDQKIKVFLNVCRHRGAQLVSTGQGCGLQDFTCPFHGWIYRQGRGLVELKSAESVGMVWVLLDSKSEFPLSKTLDAVTTDFSQLGVAPRFPMKEFVHIGHFNWKIGVEAFLEVDHFPFAHAPYLSNLEFPGLSLGDALDEENYRIVVPLKKPSPGEFLLEWAQVMYFIFPSTFLLFYSDHVALISLTPIAVDRTEFKYIPLVPQEADLDNSQIQKKADFLRVIIQQDLDILAGIQKGLKSGANSHFTFTRSEHVLGRFHKTLR
jgi:phenylpropionate dioxygenase-like ring-hydroxylating dioxygenase large terminal subunit